MPEPQLAVQQFAELYAEADLEVRRRLRRQPDLKPQFARGVQSGLRWLREALAARLGVELPAGATDEPFPGP